MRRKYFSAMPLRVLVIPDKFKGTLSAGNVAKAIARGWKKSRPNDTLELLPMSDGGDANTTNKTPCCIVDQRRQILKLAIAPEMAA